VGKAVDQNEGAHPLRMGDGELDRPSARFSLSYYRRSLEPDRVEHGDEVSIEHPFDS
jgi:hypothetical protein